VNVWARGRRTKGWWIAAVGGPTLIALDATGQLEGGAANAQTALFLFAMTLSTAAGLWVWAWRPATRMGALMTWWPALWVAQDLLGAYPTSRLVSTFGLVLFGLGAIVVAQMALSYPNGKLVGMVAWVYIFVLGYLAQAIQNVYNVLLYDPRLCPFCSQDQATSYLHVGTSPFSLAGWNKAWDYEILLALPVGLYALWRRFLGSARGARRTMGPLVLTATIATLTFEAQLVFIVRGDLAPLSNLSYLADAGLIAVALTSFVGLALTRRARGAVGDLVVDLERSGPGGVRSALARAIGDSSLELALWLPERRVWVDEQGREMELPTGGDRAVTVLGDELAAIVHDRVFLDQPALLEAAGSAARFALENERLQAQLRSQLAELRESQARIVRAGDEERRRLERDLHDGAQQRLLSVGMALQLLRSEVGARPLLDETEHELQAALRELRELAHGIHPAAVTDLGLSVALFTLAERSPFPVEIDDGGARLPPHVETAAYFLVSEALQNAAKHARASRASVSIRRGEGAALIEIRDDGIGGAEPKSDGSGLRGLADRVSALNGRLLIESPLGGGTRLLAEIPCES
jgi:signal transduction histidine kinase